MRKRDGERLLDLLHGNGLPDHPLVHAFRAGAQAAVTALVESPHSFRELLSPEDPVVQFGARLAALRRMAADADADRLLGIELEVMLLDAWSPGWDKAAKRVPDPPALAPVAA